MKIQSVSALLILPLLALLLCGFAWAADYPLTPPEERLPFPSQSSA
jgi:hypothetical protein